MEIRYSRFVDISISEKILNTVFLLTIGLGYFTALTNLYYTYQGRDGVAGISVNDMSWRCITVHMSKPDWVRQLMASRKPT